MVSYSIVGAFLMNAPDDLGILGMTIRNLHFHVPMWFTLISLLLASYIYSIRFLRSQKPEDDLRASSLVNVAVFFGILGLCTGSLWAKSTWGQWWVNDPKLNGVAIAMMMYFAYQILRNNIDEELTKGKFSAVYNLFAFPIFIVLIIVLPKMAENSLHPGSGDTVGFNNFDLDNDLRKVFYPAVLGWILMGFWIAEIRGKIALVKWRKENSSLFNDEIDQINNENN